MTSTTAKAALPRQETSRKRTAGAITASIVSVSRHIAETHGRTLARRATLHGAVLTLAWLILTGGLP